VEGSAMKACPHHCHGVTGPGWSPRRRHPWQWCWPVTAAGTAHRHAILWRYGRGRVDGESWAGRSRGGWGGGADDVGIGGMLEP
jgi:hypothetical protein